jgi:hypothetical protein
MPKLTHIETSKAAFHSLLILKVYSLHEHKISSVLPPYHCQFGALALATAAIGGSIYSSQVYNIIIYPSRWSIDLDFLRQVEMIRRSGICSIRHRPQEVPTLLAL